MGRLLTRYSPVRHSPSPEGLDSFDLHVLSMPPAFILSQNQTLKFNCLKSLPFFSKVITALTKFLLSLADLLSRLLLFILQYFEKINGNYLLFALCQIKSHFFLIPFLIFFYRATAQAISLSRRQLVYHTTSPLALSSIFLNFFQLF